MLRVTVEMVPFGIEERARVLGRLFISNIGGGPRRGHYQWRLDLEGQPERQGTVQNFQRSKRAWALVKRVLVQALR